MKVYQNIAADELLTEVGRDSMAKMIEDKRKLERYENLVGLYVILCEEDSSRRRRRRR